MALTYEDMRVYVWGHGWRPKAFKEKGRKVLAWKHPDGRFCQDIEDAFHNERYQQEVLNK